MLRIYLFFLRTCRQRAACLIITLLSACGLSGLAFTESQPSKGGSFGFDSKPGFFQWDASSSEAPYDARGETLKGLILVGVTFGRSASVNSTHSVVVHLWPCIQLCNRNKCMFYWEKCRPRLTSTIAPSWHYTVTTMIELFALSCSDGYSGTRASFLRWIGQTKQPNLSLFAANKVKSRQLRR